MAEETPKVQNKGLLLVAVALGIIVAVIYNAHITAVRNEGKGQVVRLLQMTTAKNAGEVIEEKDVTSVPIEKSNAERLGQVVTEDQKGFVINRRIADSVQQGQWLLWSHLTGHERVTFEPTKGHVMQSFEINPKCSSPLLQPGNYVNILGRLSLAGKPPRYYRIIQGVRVLATGSNIIEQPTDDPRDRARMSSRAYRGITIEIDPNVNLQLKNIFSRLPEIDIEVVPNEMVLKMGPGVVGKINPQEPDLLKLAETAVAGPTRSLAPEAPTP